MGRNAKLKKNKKRQSIELDYKRRVFVNFASFHLLEWASIEIILFGSGIFQEMSQKNDKYLRKKTHISTYCTSQLNRTFIGNLITSNQNGKWH